MLRPRTHDGDDCVVFCSTPLVPESLQRLAEKCIEPTMAQAKDQGQGPLRLTGRCSSSSGVRLPCIKLPTRARREAWAERAQLACVHDAARNVVAPAPCGFCRNDYMLPHGGTGPRSQPWIPALAVGSRLHHAALHRAHHASLRRVHAHADTPSFPSGSRPQVPRASHRTAGSSLTHTVRCHFVQTSFRDMMIIHTFRNI